MSFRLCSQVAIGKYAFIGGVNNIEIRRSVKEIVDTCSIKMPAAGRVKTSAILGMTATNADNLPANSVATSTLWQEGDEVNILLGYNKDYRQEFKGFVRRVSPSIPVLIECEGYAWQLRRKRLIKSWKNIKLLDFLKELVDGTDILLSTHIPDLIITNLAIHPGQHPNCLTVLEYVKKEMHLIVFFQFNVLYVGIEEGVPGSVVDYRLGWNTVRTDKLKYRLAADTSVLVRIVTGKGKNNKRTLVQAGDPGGSVVTENICNILNPGNLQDIANRMLLDVKYNGYEGEITGFLQPYCNPSDTANIVDKQYDVRQGRYFVEGIEIKFGMQGAQRIVHIGRALSTPAFLGLIKKNDGI